MRLSALLALLSLLLVVSMVMIEYERFISTPMQVSDTGMTYTIQPGSSLRQISQDLYKKALSGLPVRYLELYGQLTGKDHLIKAGEYHIASGTTLPQFFEQIVHGLVIQHSLTIAEGITLKQLIKIITTDQRLVKTLKNSDRSAIMIAINRAHNNGEGEFLPETYYFTAGTTDVAVFKWAEQAMTAYLADMWHNRASDLPYQTAYEALIMASIIEKETAIAEERPQIAGVFVRRLQKGMKLQADPTIIYGLGDQFDGTLSYHDLRADTPYNTYTRYGLPPTPIALPGKASIEAALHPAISDNLYFVATGDNGRHVFSSTLSAHNEAVKQYRLKNDR